MKFLYYVFYLEGGVWKHFNHATHKLDILGADSELEGILNALGEQAFRVSSITSSGSRIIMEKIEIEPAVPVTPPDKHLGIGDTK